MDINTVEVKGDILGNVISRSKKNEEIGYIRVVQNIISTNGRGFLKNKVRSALIRGKISELAALNLKVGDKIPGKIIVQESLHPFSEYYPEKDLKRAGKDGPVCTLDDQPIYMRTLFTSNIIQQDELIQHNNTEQIKEQQSLHTQNDEDIRL